MSADLQEILSLITSNTIPDSWNELSIGRIAYKEFDIQSINDLWRVNAAILYREPVLKDFKKQYFQKAGLTLYTLEGTCIDIARAVQFTAMANERWNPFIIIVLDVKDTGHALNLIFTDSGVTVYDFNVQVTYTVQDAYNKFMKNTDGFRASLLNQIAYLVQEKQGLNVTSLFMIQIGVKDKTAKSPSVFLYAQDFSADLSTALPPVGTVTTHPDNQAVVSQYIGNRAVVWKVLLELYPYALYLIGGLLLLLLII